MRQLPNTISLALSLRMQYNSYMEFSEPLPEEYWDFPHLVREHLEKIYPHMRKASETIDVENDVND